MEKKQKAEDKKHNRKDKETLVKEKKAKKAFRKKYDYSSEFAAA